ncbi:YueH family protein [Bacillus massilinigeriensis]|uniref:YueH family protein n=1 Tax=Bacillus mediterraneensis TaxID=1805474 RepID=UPI0008F84774|nr:YueH family protein [Bacillus mediterraneensis]
MIHSHEKINISGNKLSEVFMHKTADGSCIVAIPDIHWSAKFHECDQSECQFNHLKHSLNFHLYEGNTDALALAIMDMAKCD